MKFGLEPTCLQTTPETAKTITLPLILYLNVLRFIVRIYRVALVHSLFFSETADREEWIFKTIHFSSVYR
jgi:hypothetical protein